MPRTSLIASIRSWWQDQAALNGFFFTLQQFVSTLWAFARESTPSRRRQRYGDVDYDWDFRVDTTSATVGWRDRLLGHFHSPYQPTEPTLFREMIENLMQVTPKINLPEFTFIDIGSGKGRALLMASQYPFRRILGIELLPELHRVAKENISKYKSDSQQCFAIDPVGLRASPAPWHCDRRGIDHMTINTVGLQQPMDPKTVEPSFLDDHDGDRSASGLLGPRA